MNATLVGSSIRDLCLIGESCTNYSPSVWGVSKGLNLYGYGSDSANYYAQGRLYKFEYIFLGY